MKYQKVALFLIALNFSISLQAGIADLKISIEYGSLSFVEFAQVGDFSITVTNLGPNDAGANSNSNFPISIFSSPIAQDGNGNIDIWVVQDNNINQECYFTVSVLDPMPGSYPKYVFGFSYPQIPSGNSITCYGKYLIGFREGQKKVKWSIYNFFDVDPDESNNEVNMIFRAAPAVIPLLSPTNLFILCVLMLLIVTWHGNTRFQTIT